MRRPAFLPLLALLLAPFLIAGAALAHHGLMIWDDETVVTIEGFISEEMDQFPHWEISVRTPDGKDWKVDVGSEFELQEARLDPATLQIGTEVTVEGNPAASEPDARLLRPLRIIVGDTVYEFRGNWN